MSGWQPIDTAPKDGTPVLVSGTNHNEEWRVVVAWWEPEATYHCDGPEDYEGWYTGAWTDGRIDHWTGRERHLAPTHWMPLPEAPTDD